MNRVTDSVKCGQAVEGPVGFRGLENPGANPSNQPHIQNLLGQVSRSERLLQFIKFCMVGGSGVFVDMGILYLLADPRCLGLNITLSKICAAEIAMTNNFIWNEFWTFSQSASSLSASGGVRCGGESRADVGVSLAHRMGEGSRVRAGGLGRRLGLLR